MRSKKEIELYKLRELVEGFYEFDISQGGRQQDLIYARKVYCKLARDNRHTFQSIGDSIGMNHATILYHYNSFETVLPYDMEVYEKCLKVYNMLPNLDPKNLSIKIEANSSEKFIKAKYEAHIQDLNEKIVQLESKQSSIPEDVKPILSLMDSWDESDKYEFIEYRLKPYNRSIQNRKFN